MRDLAHAAIDVSDGLIADLGHVLEASGVGAVINIERVPVSPWLQGFMDGDGDRERGQELALTAGDDYELCFTVAARQSRRGGKGAGGFIVPIRLRRGDRVRERVALPVR